jgi:hypothetical protein
VVEDEKAGLEGMSWRKGWSEVWMMKMIDEQRKTVNLVREV